MSFCSLTKGITWKICRLCVCVLINKHSFEPFNFTCLDIIEMPSNFFSDGTSRKNKFAGYLYLHCKMICYSMLVWTATIERFISLKMNFF